MPRSKVQKLDAGQGDKTMSQTNAPASLPGIQYLGSMHEGIPVGTKNLAACVKFYTDVLGLKLLPRPKALDDLGPGAWLGDTDNTVQFHLIATERDYKPGPGAKYSPTGRHTAWLVKDIEAFRARMHALDIPYGEAKNLLGSGSAQLFIVDPEGHTWEFQEPFPKR
jgi:catechol 2,3-dioxygenase-like lactoylglutathione lyase family enzyme